MGSKSPCFKEIPAIIGGSRKFSIKEGLLSTASTGGFADKNLISQDSAIRMAGLEHLKWAIDCCKALGSEVLCGPLHSAPGVFSGNFPTDEEKAWAAEGLNKAAEYGQQNGVLVTVEYLNHFESYLVNTLSQTKELIERADHVNLGIHYDTHHAHYEEYHIAHALGEAGSMIKHVHYSESNRGIPGHGQVDWETNTRALKEAGYDGWIVIEAFSPKVDSLRQALHLWRELFKTPQEVYQNGIDLINRCWKG